MGCTVWMAASGLGRRMWNWLLTHRGMAASPHDMIQYGHCLMFVAAAVQAMSNCV